MTQNILPDKSGNSENPEKIIATVRKPSTSMSKLSEDMLRAFYRLFYLQFCDSSDQ